MNCESGNLVSSHKRGINIDFPYIQPSNKNDRLTLRFFFGGGGAWGFCYFGMIEELAKRVSKADPNIQNAHVEFVTGTSAGSQMAIFMSRVMNLGYNFADSLAKLVEVTKPFYDEFGTISGNMRIARSFNFGLLFGQNSEELIEQNLTKLLETALSNIPQKIGDTDICITSSLQDRAGKWHPIHNINDNANIDAVIDSCRVKSVFSGRRHQDGYIWDGGYTENPTLKSGLATIGRNNRDLRCDNAFNIVAMVEDPHIYAHANSKEPEPISVGGREMVSSTDQIRDIEELARLVGRKRVCVTSMFNAQRVKPWYYSELTKFVPNWKTVTHFRDLGREMGRETFESMERFSVSQERTLAPA